MASIHLNDNKGFRWFNNGQVYFKGYFFDASNTFYFEKNALTFFNKVESTAEFLKLLKEINGVFTLIVRKADYVLMTSDVTRIFPVFYSIINNELVISDDVTYLRKQLDNLIFDKKQVNQFKLCGYTLGSETLINNIYEIQSSEALIFQNNKIKDSRFLFSYSCKKYSSKSYNALKSKSILSINNAFERLVKSLKGKTAIIPLSGGYDSRLIACMLKKYQFDDVICYTYGKKNNPEVINSKETAKKLGYKWIFIEYNEELIKDFLTHTNFKDYVEQTFHYSSMFFLQEYFSVKYLNDNELIPSNSVFIPGHSGDLLGGSQFGKIIPKNIDIENLTSLILEKKFPYSKEEGQIDLKLKNQISYLLEKYDRNYKQKIPHTVFEDFDIKQKITKVIFNSSRVYSFFGFEHRFPFWDKELLEFFKKVPLEHKFDKKLYDDVLRSYFKDFELNFKSEIHLNNHGYKLQMLKDGIKRFLPHYFVKNRLIKNDWLNANLISQEMIDSLERNNLFYNSKFEDFNEINIHWYLHFCMNNIKDEA